MSDTVWYVLAGGAGALVFAIACYVSIKAQRARVREEEKLSPEEREIKRREEKAFLGVFRRGR